MRNYVIINGVNSLTIQGLAINILPPITKPMIRTQIEEIDGRDGDLVTELGYSAYDKTMEIGLWGTYDIDAIIKYFTGEGTIVFSTEPDKYYYFKILNQIDYEKLLKFKKATITFHCQPYKYPTSETPLEEQYEYVEETGTDITLDNTEETIFNKFDLIGNTEQTQYTGINLFSADAPSKTQVGITVTNNGDGTFSISGTATANLSIPLTTTLGQSLTGGQPYTMAMEILSNGGSGGSLTVEILKNGTPQYNFFAISPQTTTGMKVQVSTPSEDATIRGIAYYCGSGAVVNNLKIRPYLVKGSYTTSTIPPFEPYVGGTASPNPQFPQPIQVVSGDNEITICGKNLLDRSTCSVNFALNWGTGANFGETGSLASDYIQTTKGEKFTIAYSSQIMYYDKNKEYLGCLQTGGQTIAKTTGNTWKYFTTPNYDEIAYMRIGIRKNSDGGEDKTNKDIMLNREYVLEPYEPYTGQTYPISLGSLEMASIPNTNYKDVFVKEGENWYKREAVGKIILTGSEAWQVANTGTANWIYLTYLANFKPITTGGVSNYYPYVTIGGSDTNQGIFAVTDYVRVRWGTEDTIANYKTWLGNHNVILYWIKTTPTDIEITNETLIDQLEAIKNAISYKGQTNISQTNNDMPFVLDLSALKENSDHLVIDNIGNIYSKPTLDLEGTGIVDIYLNDEQIFEIDMTTQNEIIIDTEKMEAYTPDNLLANRLVTGDYSNFKLAPGNNDLRFSGDLTKATVTRYIRWI